MLSIAMFLCVMSYGTIAVSNDKGTVAELITAHRTAADITGVYYHPEGDLGLSEVYAWDNEGLFSYLASLEIERLSSGNEIYAIGKQQLSVEMNHSGLMHIDLYDRMIEVFHFQNGGSTEYYYLRSEADWDVITGFLDLNAEKPMKNNLLDPQMFVYFDAADQNDPLIATRRRFHAWDVETGETLLSSSDSDPANGLISFDPMLAQLNFDLPVLDIAVWVSEWDSSARTPGNLQMEDGSYSLVLEDSSAHYEVSVIYELQDGVQYDATYAFYVKYLD